MAQVEHPENLTRSELSQKQQENLRAAREEFAERLDEAPRQLPAELGPWLGVERLYLDVLLGRRLDKVADDCWEVLGPEPRKFAAADTGGTSVLLDAVLWQRHLLTLANLASRRGARPSDVDRLLVYADRGIATAADDVQAFVWKQFKYRLLVALDRPKELETALRGWIEPADADNHWRRALGYILAEQGRLKEAIALFEQIEAADELYPDDYRALAGWYLAVAARDKHERALVKTFLATEEWQLSNWLSQQLRPWQQQEGGCPANSTRTCCGSSPRCSRNRANRRTTNGSCGSSIEPRGTSACWPAWPTRSWATRRARSIRY